jgi:tRNA G18 (ribose-2'-O)-methylase SpoU
MLGQVGSLNVAVATGILLYEAFNQARRAPQGGN